PCCRRLLIAAIRLIHNPAANDGCHYLGLADLARIYLEHVLRHYDEVRDFAGLKRPFRFLAPSSVCGADRVRIDGFGDAQALPRNESPSRLAFRALTGN